MVYATSSTPVPGDAQPDEKNLRTPKQASAFLGVTVDTLNVWRATRRYPLRYCKIGRKVMYRQQDLDAFAESRLRGGDESQD